MVIVGSGAAGGWAAKALTEQGHSVLVVEAGARVPSAADIRAPAGLRLDLEAARTELAKSARRQPIQGGCYAFNASTRAVFVDDVDQPYTTDAPYRWIRCRVLGGRTVLWNRAVWRMDPAQFKPSRHARPGTDWPLDYEDLAPCYDRVERFLDVRGNRDGIESVPDGSFGPIRAMRPLEREFADSVRRQLGEPVILERHVAAGGAGSDLGPACSSAGTTLAAARRTGLLEIMLESAVARLDFDEQRGIVCSAEIVDARSRERTMVRGHAFMLCASTLESTRILLNSASEAWPHGMANTSGALGRYLVDHQVGVSVVGMRRLDAPDVPLDDNGLYIPGVRAGASGLRYGIQVQAGFPLATDRSRRRVGCSLIAFGEVRSLRDNRVAIDPRMRDNLGIPSLRIRTRSGDAEARSAAHQRALLREILRTAGYVKLVAQPEPDPPGSSIHELGTARMGSDPRTSVLRSTTQAWDIPNLFVADGSCFVTAGFQNPTLTIMALAERASCFLHQELSAGHL